MTQNERNYDRATLVHYTTSRDGVSLVLFTESLGNRQVILVLRNQAQVLRLALALIGYLGKRQGIDVDAVMNSLTGAGQP